MPRYQIPEQKRRKIVSLFEIGYSPPAIRRFFRRNYPRARVPSIRAIERLGAKFRNNGTVKNLPSSGPPCTVVNEENALAIQEIHMDDPSVSTRKLSQMIEISQSSVCKILKNILKSYPYRITLRHQIKDDDYPKRVQYAQIMSVMYADQNFKNNIWYMDEAAFHMNGCVNRWNTRIWGQEKPETLLQKPLRESPKVNAVAIISRRGVKGPYFFPEDTVTSQDILDMLELFIIPDLRASNLLNDNTWFLMDGAPVHFSNNVLEYIDDTFPGRWIGRGTQRYPAPIAWPPRSPDITPLDFYYWGFLKDNVYKNHHPSIASLKDSMIDISNSIPRETFQAVTSQVIVRLQKLIEVNGRHIEL